MKWNVFYHDFNAHKIKPFNIFDHKGFSNSVEKLLKTAKTKEEFSENLKGELMYYFWCKAEYEVIISPWCGNKDEGEKIDIYTQVMNNWEVFRDYIWSSKGN